MTSYPSNHYALLRVVNQQIGDKLRSMADEADLAVAEKRSRSKEQVTTELHEFIRNLSINSGLSKKKLYKLLSDHGVTLQVIA